MADPVTSKVEYDFSDMGGVIVFGGTGGLGMEICERFAAAGSDVAFSYLTSEAKAADLSDRLAGAGSRVFARSVKLEDGEAVRAFVAGAVEALGQVHTVVFATGPFVKMIPIAELTQAQWQEALAADAVGFFNVVNAAIPFLRQTRGSVVALSTSGTKRYPALDLMSAGPKAAVEMIVKAVAREEGRNGIRSNCVCVGQISAGQGLKMQDEPRAKKMADRALEAAPLRRWGTADDIASAVMFLASSNASFISGETLCVDGGIHL